MWQPTMFGDPAFGGPADDRGPAVTRRVWLDGRSWIDTCPGWLTEHDQLLDELVSTAPWSQRERRMYDRDVLEPRLVAAWSGDSLQQLPGRLQEIGRAMSERYAVDFDSVLVNLYRDGRDGVAWHGDTVRRRLPEAVVVTVALGERRRFLLRKGGQGPPAHTLRTGEGDLLVMGGRCQNDWQHTVPKETRAGTRISITMRHSALLRNGSGTRAAGG